MQEGRLKELQKRKGRFEKHFVQGTQLEDSVGESGWDIIALPDDGSKSGAYWVSRDGEFYACATSIWADHTGTKTIRPSADPVKVQPAMKKALEAALAEWQRL
jgi:hypothetical protein